MTAQCPWVRWGARWLARINAVEGLIRTGMLVLTGGSTGVIALQTYGHGQYAWHLVAGVVVGSIIFTYLYAEGGVFNQVKRDYKDLSTNYTDPRLMISKRMQAAVYFAAVHGRPPDEDEMEMLVQVVNEQWHELRDGVDMESGDTS